ncbi:MAG TPA: hypothetical protein PKY81_08940 [bacterium]|nr:hypothetical protein [bacterium]HPN31070.1 hypothetical protein [bacterium]
MSSKICKKDLIFIFFLISARVFFLLSIIFIALKENSITLSTNYYAAHYKIFIFAIAIYVIDYIISFSINLKEVILNNNKNLNVFGCISFLIFLTIFISLIFNDNPEDFIKTSIIIVLFLIVKYSTNPKIRYNL